MSIENLSTQGFLRLKDVLKLIPISKSTWWAGVKEGRFPKPVSLGPRTTAWSAKSINELIEKIEQGKF